MDTELTCPCCFEFYEDPVLLPCAHSFCRACIRSIFAVKQEQQTKKSSTSQSRPFRQSRSSKTPENVQVPCPSCREEVELSSTRIDSMQSNFLLQNIVKKYKEAMTLSEVFDVKSSILNNNGYVHMSPSPDNQQHDNDETIYENPYVTMRGRDREAEETANTEDHEYAYMSPRDVHVQPQDDTNRQSKSSTSPNKPSGISRPNILEISRCQISPTGESAVEDSELGKSVGMFAAEVANKASNRPKPQTSPKPSQDSHKRHSIPCRGSPDTSWRSAAIRRKSNTDLMTLTEGSTLFEKVNSSAPIQQGGAICLTPPGLSDELLEKLNRRKMSSPAVRPKPSKPNSLARRSKTVDNFRLDYIKTSGEDE